MMIRACIPILAMISLFPLTAQTEPFSWQRDTLFHELEKTFTTARQLSAADREERFQALVAEGNRQLAVIRSSEDQAPTQALMELESIQFRLAAIAGAHHSLLKQLQGFIAQTHREVVSYKRDWNDPDDALHDAMYRVLYGGRAAIEEAWIQNQTTALPEILNLNSTDSATPSALVEGVRIHSGDIMLSRAGAPTSALIARGNDYPGNFSHAALVYVDPATHIPTVIEALIENGVAINSLEQYLADKKRRILLLRLRPDHPSLVEDPMLPHKAAEAMLAKARSHIDYDFEMNWQDGGKYFCSEVPYQAYHAQGISLWNRKTTMSAPGVRKWLGDMGVRFFTTLAPSDLEYDPQLVSVVEWRDSETLKDDRIDNAIMDVLLEQADHGLRLRYPAYKLPLAGLVKLWSQAQAIAGLEPTIPKGMSVGAALRVKALVDKVYPPLRSALKGKAKAFLIANGYEPPYWTLLNMARAALEEQERSLSAHLYLQVVSP